MHPIKETDMHELNTNSLTVERVNNSVYTCIYYSFNAGRQNREEGKNREEEETYDRKRRRGGCENMKERNENA